MSESAVAAPAGADPIRLWDLPVRVVHWALVACVAVLWWSGENGKLDIHKLAGYGVLGLVVFRLMWGLIGSATARFASFVKGPGAIARYLRRQGDEPPVIGHNPIGALSVLALLGLLGAQVGFGLFAQDVDGIESGPLAYLVDYDTADWARDWHHLLFDGILILIALHVAAIVFYRVVKRDNLVTPMITGNKAYAGPVTAPAIAPPWRWIVCAVAAAGLAYWVSQGAHLP